MRRLQRKTMIVKMANHKLCQRVLDLVDLGKPITIRGREIIFVSCVVNFNVPGLAADLTADYLILDR